MSFFYFASQKNLHAASIKLSHSYVFGDYDNLNLTLPVYAFDSLGSDATLQLTKEGLGINENSHDYFHVDLNYYVEFDLREYRNNGITFNLNGTVISASLYGSYGKIGGELGTNQFTLLYNGSSSSFAYLPIQYDYITLTSFDWRGCFLIKSIEISYVSISSSPMFSSSTPSIISTYSPSKHRSDSTAIIPSFRPNKFTTATPTNLESISSSVPSTAPFMAEPLKTNIPSFVPTIDSSITRSISPSYLKPSPDVPILTPTLQNYLPLSAQPTSPPTLALSVRATFNPAYGSASATPSSLAPSQQTFKFSPTTQSTFRPTLELSTCVSKLNPIQNPLFPGYFIVHHQIRHVKLSQFSEIGVNHSYVETVQCILTDNFTHAPIQVELTSINATKDIYNTTGGISKLRMEAAVVEIQFVVQYQFPLDSSSLQPYDKLNTYFDHLVQIMTQHVNNGAFISALQRACSSHNCFADSISVKNPSYFGPYLLTDISSSPPILNDELNSNVNHEANVNLIIGVSCAVIFIFVCVSLIWLTYFIRRFRRESEMNKWQRDNMIVELTNLSAFYKDKILEEQAQQLNFNSIQFSTSNSNHASNISKIVSIRKTIGKAESIRGYAKALKEDVIFGLDGLFPHSLSNSSEPKKCDAIEFEDSNPLACPNFVRTIGSNISSTTMLPTSRENFQRFSISHENTA